MKLYKQVHFVGILALAFAGAIVMLASGGTNPVPSINQPLVPAAVAPGSPGFTLTVNGTGFVSGSVVNWNGSARATTFVNSSQLTASILASHITAAGTASVTVVSPTPGGGVSNVAFLPVTTAAGTVVMSLSDFGTSNSSPERQAVGDFNQDGKLDLAIQDPDGVRVLLGNGDGTFQQPGVLNSVAGGTGYMTVGDFNGDGKPDIAALGNGVVAILLGNGDGTFQPAIESPIDTSCAPPFSLAAGDFNNDGKLDLVVGYQCGTNVSVLLGNGDGTFQPFVDYQTDAEPGAVAVGDFNRDGKLDIATANFGSSTGNTVSILLGNGDGTFQPHVEYSTKDFGPLSLVAADFNGDGNLDLAVDCSCGSSTCGPTGSAAVLLGNGDGTFKPAVIYDADELPFTIATGDFNGDGKLDLALTDLDSANISFLLGNADGTFQPHFEIPLGSAIGPGAGPVGLVTGDFNGDGLLDLVTDGTFSADQCCGPFGCHICSFHAVALMLQIQVPVAAFSTASLNFGNQDVGSTSAAQTVTLTNPGRESLTISNVFISAGFAETDTCAGSILPGANCTFTVTFTPTAPGPVSGQLKISDNVAGGSQSVSLAGTGVVPVVSLSSASLSFGSQVVSTTSTAQTMTLANTGSGTLSITSIAITGTNNGDFAQTNTCATSVPAGGNCSISVTFKPTASGTRTSTLTMSDNASNSPQMVALSGVGEDFSLSSNPTSATVTAGSTASYTLSVTPAGGFSASVSLTCSVSPSPTLAPQCSISPASVNPGTSATLTVSTTPSSASARLAGDSHPLYALWLPFLGLAWMGIGLSAERGRNRKLLGLLTFCLLLTGWIFQAACGGGSRSSSQVSGSPGTPAGMYTITITGTSGAIQHSMQVTVTVQ